MGLKNIVWMGILVVLVASCGAPKVMTSYKTNAENFVAAKDYTQATEAWKQYFNQTSVEEIPGDDFASAAKTAFKSGNNDLALSWFDQARYKNYADFEMYTTLAKVYETKDNLSKELSALEYITENYSDQSSKIDDRLFDVYYEIEATDKAMAVWEKLDETSKNNISKIETYFEINRALKDSVVCDSVSLVILEKNPQHLGALDWNAKRLYWLGENRYQKAMATYEKNKTTKQYRVLLKELDLATADFKKSLIYFEKLWANEGGKKYASYFANVYARFGDEKKSRYYKGFIE